MRTRFRAGRCVTSCPKSSTEPAVGGNSPETTLKSVVLPAPFGPRIARRSPGKTSRSTSSHARTPPKRRPIPRRRRIGSASGASSALDGTAAAISVRRSARSASSALLRPRRRIRLLALRVGPVGRRRLGAEEAAERLVDLRNRLDRLHVGDAVPVVVRDDLLEEVVHDRLAVLVELD